MVVYYSFSLMEDIVNVNCGVLGHIDSGKTALCRALHQVASTASMDKNPQSQERGITLDLGFSSFVIPPNGDRHQSLQVTLVDCPGHAGLIRTVLGGAQIIDLSILVIDAQKGFQTQTAECLVIAEILCPRLLIIVNKIDLISGDKREGFCNKFEVSIRKTLSRTRLPDSVPIVFASASRNEGIPGVISALSTLIGPVPTRDSTGPLHFAFDHCFSVKGQGTVFTGTVLSGSIRKGQTVVLPHHNQSGEVRSIQKFRKQTTHASQGDRVGICVPGITAGGKERGDIHDASHDLVTGNMMVFVTKKIRYFKQRIENSKFHVSIGHTHTMASPFFFRVRTPTRQPDGDGVTPSDRSESLISSLDRQWDECKRLLSDPSIQFELIPDIDVHEERDEEPIFCLLLFARTIKCPLGTLMVASKLDLDENHPGCRLAFYGRGLPTDRSILSTRVLKSKSKEGQIDRHQGGAGYLVRGLLKKSGSDPTRIIGCDLVHESSGTLGRIESTFGKSGLVRVQFANELPSGCAGSRVILVMHKPSLSKLVDAHSVI